MTDPLTTLKRLPFFSLNQISTYRIITIILKNLKNMIKKIFTSLLLLIFSFSFINTAFANNSPQTTGEFKAEIVVFLRQGCSHCDAEKKFLSSLEKERKDIKITRHNLEDQDSRDLWNKFTEQIEVSKVTPITVVGQSYIIGFDKTETTGKDIIKLVEESQKNKITTDLDKIKSSSLQGSNATCDDTGNEPCTIEQTYFLNLPFLGKIDALSYPLLSLSVILGFLDGFNPCAMWVLVTFLVILMQVGDRRKMFVFAGTFIFAEAVMYTLILTVWYKTWDFVQLDSIVTPIIGIVSIIGGFFFLKEWRKKEIECKVTNVKQKKKTTEKIQSLAANKFTFFTFLSILGIAFSVNIIEFACSIGIPQAFTKILELNQLSSIEMALYILTYIFFYMIDDLLVFGLALYGMDKLALTAKYTRFSNLAGGIIMIILGFILIFKPSIFAF